MVLEARSYLPQHHLTLWSSRSWPPFRTAAWRFSSTIALPACEGSTCALLLHQLMGAGADPTAWDYRRTKLGIRLERSRVAYRVCAFYCDIGQVQTRLAIFDFL
ncbi:hypothetical protein CERSUDRAFT_109906 [Gelatoporia subvermispora B]|uniref:Uncharacterized protein n=1 Tax=Ceriporiopsis subvermispora (strain B) TaxID=914234 RepID=M2RS89_CERS8|nr:hypothetical protein CERSUDRAFT_109906 [Gelatoporia subvermispora B]